MAEFQIFGFKITIGRVEPVQEPVVQKSKPAFIVDPSAPLLVPTDVAIPDMPRTDEISDQELIDMVNPTISTLLKTKFQRLMPTMIPSAHIHRGTIISRVVDAFKHQRSELKDPVFWELVTNRVHTFVVNEQIIADFTALGWFVYYDSYVSDYSSPHLCFFNDSDVTEAMRNQVKENERIQELRRINLNRRVKQRYVNGKF